MTPVAETAGAEPASAAARKPADTAAPLQDTVMQKAAAERLNALKTVVEVSAAAALHADTAAYKRPEVAVGAVAAGATRVAVDAAAVTSSLPVVAAEGLCAAVAAAAAAAETGPGPVKPQGHFQVLVLLLVCGQRIHQERGL